MDSKPGDHFYADRTLLGARLKWWRTQQGLTIENVAADLGVSTATWGHWETGHTFPSGDMLLNISLMTKLPLQLLFCPHMEACPFHHPLPLPDAAKCVPDCGTEHLPPSRLDAGR
jgi:transcriptional regulator with XRE-family HTH domain